MLFALLFIYGCSPKFTEQTGSATESPKPGSASIAQVAPSLTDTTLLWKITTPGAAAPSYLFGTIHIIPEADYFMPSKVVRALNATEEVVFEIDPRDMQDMSKMLGLMMKLNMKNGTKISDLLSDEEYATVKSYFQEMGIPFGMMSRMKPLFLSAMVGQGGEGGGMPGIGGLGGGPSGMKSYEMELTEIAKAAGKEIGGLETMDFQMSLFDSIAYEDQARMLYEAVVADQASTETGGENQMDQMVAMYRRQAVAEMASMMSEETAEVNRFEELLLTRRNENWAPIIKTAAASGPVFYAVGAGHLGGTNGVIALLRGMGVSVEPVF
ncbi:hypothetical protein A3850_014535 [Lewinella sp. 4G2]|nr:hypothetical protein A3850_014535 [Lewinella sp. 4G2]